MKMKLSSSLVSLILTLGILLLFFLSLYPDACQGDKLKKLIKKGYLPIYEGYGYGLGFHHHGFYGGFPYGGYGGYGFW